MDTAELIRQLHAAQSTIFSESFAALRNIQGQIARLHRDGASAMVTMDPATVTAAAQALFESTLAKPPPPPDMPQLVPPVPTTATGV